MNLLNSRGQSANHTNDIRADSPESRVVFELVDALPEPILLFDHRFCVEFTNREYNKIFDASPDPNVAVEFADRIAQRIKKFGPLENLTIEQQSFDEIHVYSVKVASLPEAARVMVTLRAQPKTDTSLLVEAAGEGIFAIDLNGLCYFVNAVASAMLGYPPEECLGRNMHLLSHYKHADGSDYPREECPAYLALRQGKGCRVEDDLIWRKDGTSLAISVTTQPVLVDGIIIGAVVTMNDITNRKRREEHSDKRAEELTRSNAELQQFAYAAAHDLQEPIHTIGGFAGLLRKYYAGDLASTANSYLSLIAESTERMAKMIRDLLAYAELNARPLEWRDVPLEGTLAQTLNNLAGTISETGTVVSHQPLPTVNVDETLMVQLFQNLIANAIKYRADRPVRISIGAREQDGEWLFSVHDNGLGMAREKLDTVFDLFQRAAPAGRSGAGIGLATCRKVVDAHGGRIWVVSTPGIGSTFYFTLPFFMPLAGQVLPESR